MIEDGEVRTKQLESIVVKLLRVVRDNNLRDSKLTNDVFLNQIFGVPFSDFGVKFCFDPICEVFYGNNQEFSL